MEGAGEKYVDEKNWSRGRRRVENDLAKVAKVEAFHSMAKVEAGDTFHSVSPAEPFYHSAHFTGGLSHFTRGLTRGLSELKTPILLSMILNSFA